MALDFAILNKDGFPEKSVEIGVNLHHALISLANSDGATKVIKRMGDYYEDSDFSLAEIPSLIEELELVKAKNASEEIKKKIEEMIELSKEAIRKKIGISVIAD